MDYGYLFENIVKKVWGNPKTTIYFANLHNSKGDYKIILYAICIYVLNYQDISEEEKQILNEYISDEIIYSNDKKSQELMDWFKHKYNL